MKAITLEIENKINDLLGVLDTDIKHVQKSLSWLNELRGLIIKRDEKAMGELIGNIQKGSGGYVSNESKRNSIREALAQALGIEVKDMTLTNLESMLEESSRIKVSHRKEKLKTLVEKLSIEHLRTSMLLSDCSRFNSLLLKSVLNLGNSEEAVTYSSSGATKRHNENVLMNLEF
ncbi:MAG: hypothetical protein FVQ80_05860 [Planctomycetes bacterium]|nr:hypothetical protein [Planctomycetota bacterium]